MDIVEAFQALCSRDRQQWSEAVRVLWQPLVGKWRDPSFGELWNEQSSDFCVQLLSRGLTPTAATGAASSSEAKVASYLKRCVRNKCLSQQKHEKKYTDCFDEEATHSAGSSTTLQSTAHHELQEMLERFHQNCLPALQQQLRSDARHRWMEDWGRLEALAMQAKTMEELAQEYHRAGHSETVGKARISLQQRNSRFRRRALEGIQRLRAQKKISQDDAALFEAFIEKYCRQRKKPTPSA